MIIEQSKEQLQEAIHLHTRAEIKSIRLAESHLYSRSRIDSMPATGLSFDIKFTPGTFTVEPGSLTLNTDFSFAISQEGDEDSVIRIECRFEGQYYLVADYAPSPEQIEAFRTANAVFNSWPYFREYVQNTTVRMGFPPPPVEFLRLVQKQPPGPTEKDPRGVPARTGVSRHKKPANA